MNNELIAPTEATAASGGTSSWFILILVLALIVIVGVVLLIIALASSKKKPAAAGGDASYFDGNTWQLIGYRLLMGLVCTVTLGIAYPWMHCMVQRWEMRHTVIHGRRLKFTGRGHQLIGKYLLWVFLTIITFGIYGIWLGLSMKKWTVKHTVYADEETTVDSYFSGGAGGYLGIHLLAALLTVVTFGIGKAWADRKVMAWEARHTHIGGSPLVFNGSGGQLFGKYVLLVVLTPLTLGIYALFFPVILIKWRTSHTDARYQTPEIQAQARAHEAAAVQDYARFRIAANDQEIAALKSGYTGTEDVPALERMAEENNPFAAYRLACILKGVASCFEGRALQLLQRAADSRYHPALLDLAKQLPTEQANAVFAQAAQCGNAEACWHLANAGLNVGDLQCAAYWFRVAMEWGYPEAVRNGAMYDALIQKIALQLSEDGKPPKTSKALPIVLGIVGAIVLVVVGFLLMMFLGIARVDNIGANTEEPAAQQIEDVLIWQSADPEYLQGELTSARDWKGNTIEYVLSSEAFLDREKNVLYVEFGVIRTAYDLAFYAELGNGEFFETGAIPGSGLLEIAYPYTSLPSEIAIIDYEGPNFIKFHPIRITEGSSSQAQTWLEERATAIRESNLTQSPSGEADYTQDIRGDWVHYDRYAHAATGDDTLEIWKFTFNSDGTYSFIHNECMVSTEGHIYYDGRCWATVLGYGQDGTYTLAGDRLTLQYYLDGENAILTSTEYAVELQDGMLSLYCNGWETERTFTNNGDSDHFVAPEVDAASIVGEWIKYDVYQATGTLAMDLERWVFQEDGTCVVYMEYCYPSPQEPTNLYFDGYYWIVGGGWSDAGTYTFDGVELEMTTTYYDPPDYSETIVSSYTVESEGDTLWLTYSNGDVKELTKRN